MKEILKILKALFRSVTLPYPQSGQASIFSVSFSLCSLAQETGCKAGYINTFTSTLKANVAH